MQKQTRTVLRAVNVARVLALLAASAGASCASTTGGDSGTDTATGDGADATMPPDCDCCPTGDWSGVCMSNPMLADASHTPIPPDAGRRWCVGDENMARGCPIAGPLMPPECAA